MTDTIIIADVGAPMTPALAAAALLTAVVLVASTGSGAAEAGEPHPPQPPGAADGAALTATNEQLTQMQMRLTDEEPYHFVLAYRGTTMPFRGLVCYHFAGYNETCVDPGLDWLTPATRIELFAPGGVPRDLLRGYIMLVRFPALSERSFRYTLRDRP